MKEYQIELNPDAMYAFNVSVMDIMSAIKKSNLDIGAETMEINKVEYLIRGLGYIKNVKDIENAVITVREGVPVRISDVAFVNIGPGTRRGGLDKEGVEAVGGVVVARYGSNPLEVINNVKAKIKEMEPGLPQKVLADGTVSKVTVVPFYDRTGLIKETIGTLETALSHEILICVIVIIVLVLNLRASIVIASMLPIAVLATFIIMRYTGIAANIVALSGIAIAIGVMVDVGVVFVESIIRYREMPENRHIQGGKAFVNLIYKAVSEVSGAISTAMITTIVSFLPVFTMEAQEGKMFSPLCRVALTGSVPKTAALSQVLPSASTFSWAKIFSQVVGMNGCSRTVQMRSVSARLYSTRARRGLESSLLASTHGAVASIYLLCVVDDLKHVRQRILEGIRLHVGFIAVTQTPGLLEQRGVLWGLRPAQWADCRRKYLSAMAVVRLSRLPRSLARSMLMRLMSSSLEKLPSEPNGKSRSRK